MSLKVQMKTQYATPTLQVPVGGQVTLPDDEALQLIDHRCAVAVDREEEAELRRKTAGRRAPKKTTSGTGPQGSGSEGAPPAGGS